MELFSGAPRLLPIPPACALRGVSVSLALFPYA
jgi:hypothetical protein